MLGSRFLGDPLAGAQSGCSLKKMIRSLRQSAS